MNKYANRGSQAQRQAAILDLISRESVGTQEELVKALKRRGIVATQVSISRDIASLGLMKIGGQYRAAAPEAGVADPEMPLRIWVRGVAQAGDNLVVVRCDAGTAQRVGLVLDGAAFSGLVGTIAGDDTVFAAVADKAAAKRLMEFIRSRMKTS